VVLESEVRVVSKLKIVGIHDRNTYQNKDSFRVGRVGKIQYLELKESMWFIYDESQEELKGKAMVTSPVTDIEEDDYGVRITTENSIYLFDHICEEI
jgi:hypothetical protein